MGRLESRIVFDVLAVFVALAGLAASIRGWLFDELPVFRYGVAAVIGGVACLVLLLNSSVTAIGKRRNFQGAGHAASGLPPALYSPWRPGRLDWLKP